MTVTILAGQLRIDSYRAAGLCDDDALAAAIEDAHSGSNSCRIGWNGPLILTRPPPPLYRVHLEGDDKLGATVRKQYPGGVLFDLRGPDDYSGGGLHNFAVPKDTGSAGSYIIYYKGASGNCSGIILEHLYLNQGGDVSQAPFQSIHIDAAARLSPQGFREAMMSNIVCFGTVGANCFIAGAVGLSMEKVGTYPAGGGDAGNADFYLQGGDGWQSCECSMSNCQISGALRVGDVKSSRFEGTFGSFQWLKPTADHVTIQPRGATNEIGARPASCRVI